MFLDYVTKAAAVAGSLSAIVTVLIVLVKPLRDKILGIKYISSGVKCLLRADMLSVYYKHHDEDTIRQYERENFDAEYRAYKALGGNSFIDTINEEVKKWEVIP